MMRLKKLKGGVEIKVLLECAGKSYDYQGKVSDLAFASFLDDLPPPRGHWLHDYLSSDGPMGCKH